MIYLIAEDSYYYTSEGMEYIEETYKVNKVYPLPKRENLKDILSEKGSCIIAPSSPARLDPLLEGNSLFTVIDLPNKFGILTTTEKELGISEVDALSNKLGISIYKPTLKEEDMAASEVLKDKLKEILNKVKVLWQPKGLFLIGIPGTGKSFFAKWVASMLGYFLVELNLSQIIQSDRPIATLNMLFQFFETSGQKYIIWMDEIEKMIDSNNLKSNQVLGVLLTRLNETKVDMFGRASIISIATANNITKLAESNPELFRKGRFDDIIFLDLPTENQAKEVLKVHLKKQNKHIKKSVVPYHFFGIFADDFNIKNEYKSDEIIMSFVDKYSEDMRKLFLRKAKYYVDVARGNQIDHKELSDENMSIELTRFADDIKNGEYKSESKIQERAFEVFVDDVANCEDERIRECVNDYDKYFGVPLETIDRAILLSQMKYRQDALAGAGRGTKFIYVHSEIELLAMQMFLEKKKVLDKKGIDSIDSMNWDEIINSSINSLIPIQVTMKPALGKMIGISDGFTTN